MDSDNPMKRPSIRLITLLIVIAIFYFTGITALHFIRRKYAADILEYVVKHPESYGGTYNDDFVREQSALDRVHRYHAEEQARDRLFTICHDSNWIVRMKAILCLGAMAEYDETSMLALRKLATNPDTPKEIAEDAIATIEYYTVTSRNLKGYLGEGINNGKTLFFRKE